MTWWLAVSWFTHVTVVPFGTVILAGVKAKFWIVTVGLVPGGVIGVVVGAAVPGVLLVHPHRATAVTRTTIRIAR